MKFNLESQNSQTEEIIEETSFSSENLGTESYEEEIPLTEYFDDGFGDEMPKTIELNSDEDIEEIKHKYNIDLKSYLEKDKAA